MWRIAYVDGKATRLGLACLYQGRVPEKYDSREALFAEFNKQIFEGPILQFTFCSIFTGHVSTAGIDLVRFQPRISVGTVLQGSLAIVGADCHPALNLLLTCNSHKSFTNRFAKVY